MKIRKLSLICIAVFCIFMIAGCSKKIDHSEVKYADSITENMLLAQNNKDYSKFTQDADNTVKNVLKEDDFKKSCDVIEKNYGKYKEGSIKFEKAVSASQNGNEYTIVIYSSKFEKTNMNVFITFDSLKKVAGIRMNK